MDKRYQVFVSSTYVDLKDERQKVTQTLMEMDCIPAGMELFPAVDEEQWQFIQKVIDDCDYYIVIVGGRYGSLTDDGISFTEKEYDYALSIGLKVLAFIHERPKNISVEKSDVNSRLVKKLEAFRRKLKSGRMVKMWKSADELPGLVSLSLSKTIKLYPAVGWIRASHLASEMALSDLNELRKENERLLSQLKNLESMNPIQTYNLASLDEPFSFDIVWKDRTGNEVEKIRESATATWAELFGVIGPSLAEQPSSDRISTIIARRMYLNIYDADESPTYIKVEQGAMETIRLQFTTLGLITLEYLRASKSSMALFWSITDSGRLLLINLRAIKSSRESSADQ